MRSIWRVASLTVEKLAVTQLFWKRLRSTCIREERWGQALLPRARMFVLSVSIGTRARSGYTTAAPARAARSRSRPDHFSSLALAFSSCQWSTMPLSRIACSETSSGPCR